ncbi:carbon-nitrogen hydrolase family protein (plasmid) [Legionella sp. D16C41]|uniref:carbon-nitrogen hydrolase family protein n=1 Tax=Legionella sp. D16C41 TaxID=3402688 RepID=UPI003AF828A9
MPFNKFLSIAVFQGEIQPGDFNTNLEKTIQQLDIAEARNIDILCMPESFLHGYFDSREEAFAHSIDLDSAAYSTLLEKLKRFNKTTLLIGLNEKQGNEIYNTVVIIEKGRHIGKYRKAYTYSPYDYFTLGQEFPVFEKKGIKYGVVICIDCAYQEPCHILALKGAQLIFCPMYNKVKHDARMLNYLNRRSHFIARAFENECWFASSDIILENDEQYVCPGSASILDKNGEVVCLSEPFTEMLLQYNIPITSLRDDNWSHSHYRRLLGNNELRKIAHAEYIKRLALNTENS